MLLAKVELSSIKILIYKALIYSNINHDQFILAVNMLREYNEMKERIKNPANATDYPVKNNGNL